MKRKYTIEYMKNSMFNEGYILLSTVYISAEKLEFICPNGHRHRIKWGNWKQGKRCKYCFHKRLGRIKRMDLNYIKKSFDKEGYKLFTVEYKNSDQKLDYICPEGHRHSIRWNNWRNGQRCFYCYGNIKPSIKDVKREFLAENYKLLTKNYKNSRGELRYICPMGHRHHVSLSKWRWGDRCPTCYHMNHLGQNSPAWRGGISCEPYCYEWSFKEFKDLIKERDGQKCLNPDCWCNSKRLGIHHIDYNKKNCDISNLITVCISCNARANKDREWHKAWYQAILNKRYSYNYRG